MNNTNLSKQEYLDYLARKQIGIIPVKSNVSNAQFVLSTHVCGESRSSYINSTNSQINTPKKFT